MTALLSNIAEIVTSILGWVSDVCGTITSTPLLYLSLGFFVVGGGMWSAQYCSFDKYFSKPQPTEALSVFCMKIRAL